VDPFDRFEFKRRKVNIEAILAFVVGIVLAYLLQVKANFGTSTLLTVLIVLAVGGLWYHIRKVV
jgi:branched-subunit amino acid ABC-type transport system permease component